MFIFFNIRQLYFCLLPQDYRKIRKLKFLMICCLILTQSSQSFFYLLTVFKARKGVNSAKNTRGVFNYDKLLIFKFENLKIWKLVIWKWMNKFFFQTNVLDCHRNYKSSNNQFIHSQSFSNYHIFKFSNYLITKFSN